MWFRTPSDSLKRHASRPAARPARRDAFHRRARLAVEALEDRSVPASLSVGDVTLVEGNAGARYAMVRVSLNAPSTQTVSVNYHTADGTAVAGSDYDAASGKLTFAAGETSKTILVPVRGDRLGEFDETFAVKLHGAKKATIADGTGVVTVVDDEPRVRIGDVSAAEGACRCGGGTAFTFTVSLSAASDQAVTVAYATADGTATTANEDYVAASGVLTFAPGETTKTVTVWVYGDTTAEGNESFVVNLGSPSTNALVVDGQGVGTILEDDGGTGGDPCQYVCCHPDGCGSDGSGISP